MSIDTAIRRAIGGGDSRVVVAGAAGLAGFLGIEYFRRRSPGGAAAAAPVIIAGGGVQADALAAFLGQATQLGANAAASGFDAGAGLGAAGFNAGAALGQTAIQVVGDSLGGAVGALAGSQAAGLGAALDSLASIATGALGIASGYAYGASGGGANGAGGGLADGLGGGGSGGGGYSPPPVTPPGGGGGYSPPPVNVPPVTPPTGNGPGQNIAVFRAPTTVYARHTDGHIGASKTFGQAGLRIRVNSVVVPRDSHGGGTFWEMKEGGAPGWLIRPSDPNVTVMPGPSGAVAASAAGGSLGPDQGADATSSGGAVYYGLAVSPNGLPLDPTAHYTQAQLDQIAAGNYSYTPQGTVVNGQFGPLQGRIGASMYPLYHGGRQAATDAAGNPLVVNGQLVPGRPNPQAARVAAINQANVQGVLGGLFGFGGLFGR